MADPILFQDKGVMQSNINEVIRAHQVAANRVITAEKKLADLNVGDGSDFAGLKTKVDDLGKALDDVKAATDKTTAKLEQLFPDEQPAPAEPEAAPETPSASETETEPEPAPTPEP